MKSTSAEETNYENTSSYNKSSDIVDFLLDMTEISLDWSLPITITVESDS